METVLQAKNMTKIYGMGSKQPFTALENIDLEIKTGEFIVVMGPSGSGKSTLVNNISTIDIPTNGSLYILNQEVKQMSENQLGKFRYQYLGFVFQNYNLLNSLTVYENIMIPLKLIGEDKKVIDEKVHQITKELDIESLPNKYPHECSGGQQQRVAIARALIGNPKIIIADEPTGNLDSQNSHEILSIFKKMNENHITIIMVSHDRIGCTEKADQAHKSSLDPLLPAFVSVHTDPFHQHICLSNHLHIDLRTDFFHKTYQFQTTDHTSFFAVLGKMINFDGF